MEIPQLTPTQKDAAQRIVNVLETGSPDGDYSGVSVIEGDDAELRYGRAQVSLAAGHLGQLVGEYCAAPGAAHADALRPYLDRVQAADSTLVHDAGLRCALAVAGVDPVMRAVQDRFFDQLFWEPALHAAAANYIQSPLGVAIMLDSHVHGSWHRLKCSVNARYGRPPATREECWLEFYVRGRRYFLSNGPLRGTQSRMDIFDALIKARNWTLDPE